MGIPTGDRPDYIIHRLRNDVTVPWSRPIAGAVVGAWLLFVLIPWLLSEYAAATFIRWSAVALAALALTFAIPALAGHERLRAVVGTLIAAAMVALVWVATAG